MSCLSCLTVASLLSSNNSNSSSSSVPIKNSRDIRVPRTTNSPLTTSKQQPSISEIENAIGASRFVDSDARKSGEKTSLLDVLSASPLNLPEGPVEKKLRETGKWIIDTTEGDSRSSGHNILLVVCLGILPVWLFCFAVASGFLKLPFSNPILDNLIM